MLSQNGRIVQFASRSLSAVEQRYSQTEREALAITWACEHFHIYIFGSPFTVFTDYKPLTSIFNNTLFQLSARIERWILRTQPYDMTVIYRPGHNNPADYLSRHPTHLPPNGREQKIAEEYINYILSIPKAMTIDEVATETAKDKTLTTAIQAILTNKWHVFENGIHKATFHTLHANCAELSLAHKDSIILKGRRIVLPEALQNRAAKIAHARHQGIVKTMALLREKVWFKNMQPLVEENIKNCHTCQISIHKPAREPLQMSPLPAASWAEVSADFGHPPKVSSCCHRWILTLCCCRHPGLHLNNISHTPPGQDIRRIWRASFTQNGQRSTIQQPRIQNLFLHIRIQTQENNTPMAPDQS